jgi:hypothetical protein
MSCCSASLLSRTRRLARCLVSNPFSADLSREVWALASCHLWAQRSSDRIRRPAVSFTNLGTPFFVCDTSPLRSFQASDEFVPRRSFELTSCWNWSCLCQYVWAVVFREHDEYCDSRDLRTWLRSGLVGCACSCAIASWRRRSREFFSAQRFVKASGVWSWCMCGVGWACVAPEDVLPTACWREAARMSMSCWYTVSSCFWALCV